MNLYDKIDIKNYLVSIQKALLQRSGTQRFPKNSETIEALKTKDVYNIKPKNRIYLLEKLENYDNKELVNIESNNDITIEHIFPQNPDAKWKIELGNNEYNIIKDNYLNTIANLTLSGNNGKLSNKTFKEKRDFPNYGYKYSRLWLNKHLSNLEKWGKVEIEERFNIIADRFLKIWSFPNISVENSKNGEESGEVNIFDADEPKYKKLEYAIFLDQKLEVKEVAKLYVEVFKQLFELQPETFFTSQIGSQIGLTKHSSANSLRQPTQINDTYLIESNFSNTMKFDKIKQALTIFNLEDELIIKYASEN